MKRNTGIFGSLDGWLIVLFIFLVLFGWLNIYSSSITEESSVIFDLKTSHGKQLLWMCICFGVAVFILLLDSRIFPAFAFIFYGVTIVLLVLVLIIGQKVDGNKAWFVITPTLKFQPSEFAKFSTSLVLAWVISMQDFTFRKRRFWWMIFGLIALPAALILLENDTGSTIVYLAIVLALFRFGLPWILLILAASFVALFFFTIFFEFYYHLTAILVILGIILVIGAAIWFFTRNIWLSVLITAFFGFSVLSTNWVFHNVLKDHHRTRIYVLLEIVKDPKGAGWNVNNSKMAIGSGGVLGKGFMKGALTKLKYVPKQRTDFIFCTVGEEWGFWGSSLTVLIYLFFMIRIVMAAERQRSEFSRAYGYCVACIMFFHFLMNIGTTLGLAPAVGIPLPFFSYGGSSLLGFTILLWVFIKLDSQNMQILR